MSWSDDIRCLYCDGRLPLYRKLTSGQFCSAAHRKLYWQEQERLAVERLHQTHDSLKAYRPPGAVEAIMGASEEELARQLAASALPEPEPRGIIVPRVAPKLDDSPALVTSDPHAYDSQPQRPVWAPQIPQISTEAGSDEIPSEAGFIGIWTLPQPKWPTDRIIAAEPQSVAFLSKPQLLSLAGANIYEEVSPAGLVLSPLHALPLTEEHSRRIEPMPAAMLPVQYLSLSNITLSILPVTDVFQQAEASDVPGIAGSVAFWLFSPVENTASLPSREPSPAPLGLATRVRLPLDAKRAAGAFTPATPLYAGLRQLPIDHVTLVHGPWIDNLRALDLRGGPEAPQYELSTPARRPRLRLAAGSRYPVETREAGITLTDVEPANFRSLPSDVSLPHRDAAVAPPSSIRPIQIPAPTGLLPLACTARPSEPQSPDSLTLLKTGEFLTVPQPLRTEPMRPASHLEPLDTKPAYDFMPPPTSFVNQAPADPAPSSSSTGMPEAQDTKSKEPENAHVWTHAIGFWKHAPRDLKLLVFGIPILLALALRPSLPKVHISAPANAGGFQRDFQRKLNQQWMTVRRSVADRAAVALDEDFRTGLDEWTSRGDATAEWAFDATGFVRPGPLALYKPSIDLTDYQLQFLGLIDKKALSWVVRAADFDNYYVVKLVILKPGPMPTVGVVRYAVIQGKAQDRADTMAYINARDGMPYRISLDVHGETFALAVQGQMVDTWSDPRLKHGGVGFFSAKGEESRLRWVQVTHQYDMLGRLCAYLAPYNISSTNGGWQ